MSADGARVHSNGHLQELGDSSQAQSDLEWDDRLVLCCSAVSSGARTDVFAGAVLLPPSHRLDSIDTDPGGSLMSSGITVLVFLAMSWAMPPRAGHCNNFSLVSSKCR